MIKIDGIFLESYSLSVANFSIPTMEQEEDGERERDVCGRSEMCSGILGMPLIELSPTHGVLELKLG